MASSQYPEDNSSTDAYEDDYDYYEKKKARKPKRHYGGVVSTIVIIAIILILLLLVANPGFREAVRNLFNPDVGGYREYPEWADYEVERRITLTPNPPGSAMDYEVDIPIPEDIPNSTDPWLQDVKSVVSNRDRTEIKYPEKRYNYTWMIWEGNDVRSSRTLTIRYSIYTESAVWNVDPSESGTVDDVPKLLADKHGNKTKEEWVILPALPQIQSLSNQLTSGKITVYDKLRAIFDYLNDNFEYETRGGGPKYCNETLSDRSGDCDDQSVLFISLARAAGIPSWLEFGALYNQQKKSWGGHAWIRAYIPYFSGGGHVFNIDIVNDHFLFRDAFRFSEWESDGNGSHLKDYYYTYGRNFRYDESYTTISMEKSPKTIKIAENGRPIEESIPGFEGVLVVSAIVFMAILMRRKREF
ncbi:MAG: transglutaminase domain-containing protein [Thermoplasmata archaeon]